jgi:hypothetical protein
MSGQNMFCPKCGKGEQLPQSYCRQCGLFLPDLSKHVNPGRPPEEHLRVNKILNSLTIVVSFTLAILLYSILGFRPDTHPLIYVTAALLIAIGCWHIQTFTRTLQLTKQWKRRAPLSQSNASLLESPPAFGSASTAKTLDQLNSGEGHPSSVTEHTTKILSEHRT